MPPQIADREIDARDQDTIRLAEGVIIGRWKEMILQKADFAN
jgi:hypothetical protein